MEDNYQRVFLIVLDSLGIGNAKDSNLFFNAGHSDAGSNTFLHICEKNKNIFIPNLEKLGILEFCNILNREIKPHNNSYCVKLNEKSNGKDTMTGHWEMMGIHTTQPFLTFTEKGFPKELISELENRTGRKVIGNKAASGTEIIKELGEEQLKTGSLIVYTSADSVLQIAANEKIIPINELYKYCEVARELCTKPEWMVARVIARPFFGDNPSNFKRNIGGRHDLAIKPSKPTVMNILKENGLMVNCVGKISDIFDSYGVVESQKTSSNFEGMAKTINIAKNNTFKGLCFVNLVEFDSEYGHRRDVAGYAKCIEEFDAQLGELLDSLDNNDLLMLTADHGNDPTWYGTDHTREQVPLIIYSKKIKNGCMLNERNNFADIGRIILDNFGLKKPNYLLGESFIDLIK